MAKILSKTELRVLEGRTHRMISDFEEKAVIKKHKTEFTIMMDDLNVRLTNYQMLINDPERIPTYKGDAFEIEMEILRSHQSRLEYLTSERLSNPIFSNSYEMDDDQTPYSFKQELTVLGILFVIGSLLAWMLA